MRLVKDRKFLLSMNDAPSQELSSGTNFLDVTRKNGSFAAARLD
jgi:hypothetical protein